MAIAIVFLELAVLASRRLSRMASAFQHAARRDNPDQPLGGSIFAGMIHTLRSPYLGGLAIFILLYSVTSTSCTSSRPASRRPRSPTGRPARRSSPTST